MTWLVDNWYIAIGIIAVLVVAGFAIYKFTGLPTASQISKIKKWLLFAVTIAEKELGEKTGELKLRMVFDMFVTRFPLVAKVISFDTFKFWVDEALDEMKELLETNEAVKNVVSKESTATVASVVSIDTNRIADGIVKALNSN